MFFQRSSDQPNVISISTATFVKAVVIVLALWLLWYLRDVIAILFSSLLLSALIAPFADWFSRNRVPRSLAVIIVYVMLVLIGTVISLVLVPVIIEQVTQLLGSGLFSQTLVDDAREKLNAFFNLQEVVRALAQSFLDGNSSLFTGIFNRVTGLLNAVVAVFAVLMLTFYMVVEEDAAKKFFKHLAPVEYQPYLSQLFNKMQVKIGAWLRGQIALGFIVGFASWIGLTIVGVPYALLLGVIAGLLEIVPYVGPIASAVPAVIIGFTVSPLKGLLTLGLYILVQQLENNLLVPKVMQKFIGLNPVVSIVALLVGFKIGGVLGSILAIPVATMAAVVMEDLFAERSV
jgi:predicted PurR-regulated permease PerM